MPNTTSFAVVTPGATNYFAPNTLNVARVDLTAAQMLTILSAPTTIMPAVQGYIYIVTWGILYKTTASVFTTAGLTGYGIRYNNTALTPACNFLGTCLTAANIQSTTTTAGTQAQVLQLSSDASTEIGSKSLIFRGDADLGGTGSPCSVVFGYYLVPNVITGFSVTNN